MSERNPKKAGEILALTGDPGDFDLEHVSLEELERRLELSITTPPMFMQGEGGEQCSCPRLVVCGSYCND